MVEALGIEEDHGAALASTFGAVVTTGGRAITTGFGGAGLESAAA
jgi:hypothetical protein